MSRTKTSRIASAVAAVALTGGAVAATAPAASASPIRSCPDGRFCFFFNSNFEGARADFRYSDAGLGNELFDDRTGSGYNVQVNNNAASFVNNRGVTVYLYNVAGCDGSNPIRVPQGAAFNLAEFGGKNAISSVLVADGSACVNRDQSRF